MPLVLSSVALACMVCVFCNIPPDGTEPNTTNSDDYTMDSISKPKRILDSEDQENYPLVPYKPPTTPAVCISTS